MKMNKSIYKSFIDCKLKAYYEKNKTPKTNENETYMVFYNYAKLKELGMSYMASRYHFVDISNLKGVKYFNDKINETMKYIQKPGYNCICNAAFQNGPIQGQIDFLVKAPDGMRWSPVIVKASEDIKENIGVDCGFVKALLRDKVEIDKIYILSVNKSFIKHGKISDVRNLITITSKFDGKDLVDYADNFPVDFGACEMFLENPTKPVFKGCKNCKYCEWRDRCVKDGNLPEYGTLDIIYGKDTAYKYFAEGKKLIKDVPYDEDFDLRQTAQIYCEKNPDKIIFEPKKIKSFLKGLKEPYHFMDFEALNTLVPRVDGTRPFEFVPYQYSLHQTKSDLKVYNHDEFLSFDMDCRKEFLDRLLTSLGTEGSIIVWNVEFEQTRLNELAEQFPEYRKRIEALEDRYFDLMIPFDKLWFYKPEMYGKYSLKYVFPALSDVKSYNDLNVKNGLQTMILYFKILKGEINPDEVRQAMLDYCSLDTESMIYILDEMRKAIKTLTPDKYVTLTQMNKEVKEEQLNRRFKTSKIPAICSNIVHDLVADIPDDKIDEDGYRLVANWMKEHRVKDYVMSDKSDEIKMADIVNYWDSLPVESQAGNVMSKNKMLQLIRVSRFALENPESSNILKMSSIVNISKAKKKGKDKAEAKDAKEDKVIDKIDDDFDVNNPNLSLDEIEGLMESLDIPTSEEYGNFADILEEFQ